jgi:hypothetical protein
MNPSITHFCGQSMKIFYFESIDCDCVKENTTKYIQNVDIYCCLHDAFLE